MWQQDFVYEAFGNLRKSGSVSFLATYSASTNQITDVGGCTPSYTAAGQLTNDCTHSYTWNGHGKPASIDGVQLTYDALDRLIEKVVDGAAYQFFHAPTGEVMVYKSGPANWFNATNLLVAGAKAEWSSLCGYPCYKYSDWLGSSWLTSTPDRTVYYDGVYAPFGESYAEQGSGSPSYLGRSFTGQEQNVSEDAVTGLYDFWAREYSLAGRWISPDPAGLAAVDPSNPQSWNRYAYALNNPALYVDPTGACVEGQPCPYNPDITLQPDESFGWMLGSIIPLSWLPSWPKKDGGIGPGAANKGCPTAAKSKINDALLHLVLGPIMGAQSIPQLGRGGVVVVGLGASGATRGIARRLGFAGSASVGLVFDSYGNIGVAISLSGGRGDGAGWAAGGQFTTAPFANTIWDVGGSSGSVGGGRGAGLAGAIEVSSNGGGAVTETIGVGQGRFGMTFMGGSTVIVPVVCHE